MMWSLATLLLGGARLAGAIQARGEVVPRPEMWPMTGAHYRHPAAGPLKARAEREKDLPKPRNSFDLMGNLKRLPCNSPEKLDDGSSFASLARDGNGAILFEDEPLEPVHIYYRFHGLSMHDLDTNHTPALSMTSLVNTLESASKALRQSTNVYVLVNGPAAVAHKSWIDGLLKGLNLESYQIIDAPEGHEPSYKFMINEITKLRDLDESIVLMLQDDYFLHPQMLNRLVEFWSLYHPCSAVPYQDPDYYLHSKRRNPKLRHRNTLLRTPGIFWRTVGWSTGTIAVRLDLFHHIHQNALYPLGKSNPKAFTKWARKYGLWAPMPVLASQMHMDEYQPDPDFDYIAYTKELEEEASALGFRANSQA